jgi:hypothetical protein
MSLRFNYFICESLFTSFVFDNLALHVSWVLALIYIELHSTLFLRIFRVDLCRISLQPLAEAVPSDSSLVVLGSLFVLICIGSLVHSILSEKINKEETRVKSHRYYIMITAEFPVIVQFFLVTNFLTLLLKVVCLGGRFSNTSAGSLFQSWMVLFKKEYFPMSVLCFLLLIFCPWSTLITHDT